MRPYLVTSKNRIYMIELDDEDYERLIIENRYNYNVATNKGKVLFVVRTDRNDEVAKQVYLHHDVIGKPPKGKVTDHRDRNPLNNQKDNLWHCTYRQNGLNRCDNKKHPGVYPIGDGKYYLVNVGMKGKHRYIGCFKKDRYELACQIYDNIVKHEQILLDLVFTD